jgi:hypothetical protein
MKFMSHVRPPTWGDVMMMLIIRPRCHYPKVLLVLADPAPKGDQFPAAPLQKMTSPNCAHGEYQQNTSYIAKQDKTPCVTVCNPTIYVSEHERKFGVTLVNHGAKGSLAGKVHVEEGIDKHQVSDIPTLRASDVFSRTNNGREVIVCTAFCEYANHTLSTFPLVMFMRYQQICQV